ncbi:uncharacterized protein LOC133188577 [Saccostrea echinata]|uniref:uncharacterized protein LOC133188577 n=1 Tax=Saccostrea echinata TaxID=191078 RepID=UPI002A810534|nr:uncharacterized protein LOC133188577 [Saccostrea echinata]
MVALQYMYLPLLFSILQATVRVTGRCTIPDYFHGDWYSQELGADIITKITADKWDSNEDDTELTCEDIFIHPTPGPQQDGNNVTMFMVSSGGLERCYFCVDVLWRTTNILQYRKGDCIPAYVGYAISLNISCRAMDPFYGLPSTDEAVTMFRQTPRSVNCETMFEGLYQFSYEIGMGGGGICDNPDSQIKACQDPGSPYVDNEVFYMTYGRCPDVRTSKNEKLRYQCMGSWDAERNGIGYTFAAIADTVNKDSREKFKCLLTLKSQRGNKKRWVMSRFSSCANLNSIYSGPVRLVLTSIVPSTENMVSRCNLPSDIAGQWVTRGPGFKYNVAINETNIRFYTEPDAIEFLDAFYACQKRSGTRYLMTRVLVGKCEEDFVCMEIVTLNNDTVRYRIGKPENIPSYLTREELDINSTFTNVCNWFDRADIKGNRGYEVLTRKTNSR